MNGRGERQTIATVKVCFDAARATSSCRIKMDTHEDGVSIRVGDCHSSSQWNKYVTAPGHDHPIATGCQNISKAQCHIERHVFFGDSLAGNPTAIMAAVPCVDHDSYWCAVAARPAAAP